MQDQESRRNKYSRSAPGGYAPVGNSYDPELGGPRAESPSHLLETMFAIVQKVVSDDATVTYLCPLL